MSGCLEKIGLDCLEAMYQQAVNSWVGAETVKLEGENGFTGQATLRTSLPSGSATWGISKIRMPRPATEEVCFVRPFSPLP